MKIIDRYLFRVVFFYVFLAVFFLIGIQLIIGFTKELPEIGIGSYGIIEAWLCVFLTLPSEVYHFFPITVLLGVMLSLGLLAANNELIILRTSGQSVFAIAWIMLKIGLVLIIFMILIGEYLAPLAQRKATWNKAMATSGGNLLLTNRGVWLRDNDTIINLSSTSSHLLQGVTSYHWSLDKDRLKSISYAKSGSYLGDHWVLDEVVGTDFTSPLTVKSFKAQQFSSAMKYEPTLIGLASINPDQENLHTLRAYIEYRLQSGLDAKKYEVAFWQRIFAPASVLVMIFITLPFIFGSLRTLRVNFRMLIAIVLGFTFYTIHQFVGLLTLVYAVPPLLAVASPLLAFMVITLVMVSKVR